MKINSVIEYNSPVINVEEIKRAIAYKLIFVVGKDPAMADKRDWLNAVCLVVRDRLVENWLRTMRAKFSQNARQVYYLSMEFLIGRTLSNALLSGGIYREVKEALKEMGLDIEELCEMEDDPGLGNGGLGRLATCFLDSMATLGYPGWGHGLRYEYGMFRQEIIDGNQVEVTDDWLKGGNAWEFYRHDVQYAVKFGGRIQQEGECTRWLDAEKVMACAYDQIVPGYDTDVTNTLRLWSAKACSELDLEKFNQGDYFAAVQKKTLAEYVTFVLYPNDSTMAGRVLRLAQEYFLVSAAVQDIVTSHFHTYKTLDNFTDKVAIHLNDTHPVLAIPELMRILIDDYEKSWDEAWQITRQVFSYTNHTLMGEALETWPVDIMAKALPYHLQIIFWINTRFLDEVRTMVPDDNDFIRRVSIINEEGERRVRMAWLAVIASRKVNGVSRLHTELMINSLFADFVRLYPDRFCNKTNGVTPRRWLGVANPCLSDLIDGEIGKNWRVNLEQLSELNEKADYLQFIRAVQQVKLENKKRLAEYVANTLDIVIHPDALFDVQVKRIHEYKRQSLNLLHIIVRYNEMLANPDADWVPRVFFFAGKAASSYVIAKGLIRLINDVANVINHDKRVNQRLKVIFVPNYGVSIAELMIPAADLSEQISLAGFEASGTGNMKFALNGALTIGTLDGANVEIRECVGEDNIFIFGHTAHEVEQLRATYDPYEYYEKDPRIRTALTQIATGVFSPDEPARYRQLFHEMTNLGDQYQILADFDAYYRAQKMVDKLYRDPDEWTRRAIVNIANMGKFSSDRTVKEYAEEIWKIVPIKL